MTYAVPISCKGIVFEDKKVWLRLNERSEWELPGGFLSDGQQPEAVLVKLLTNELGVEMEVKNVVSNFLHKVRASFDENLGVLVAIYRCETVDGAVQPSRGAEYRQFAVPDLDDLPMPVFYKQAIRAVAKMK